MIEKTSNGPYVYCQFHYLKLLSSLVLTVTLAKKQKFDIWPKQSFLRSLRFLDNLLSQQGRRKQSGWSGFNLTN